MAGTEYIGLAFCPKLSPTHTPLPNTIAGNTSASQQEEGGTGNNVPAPKHHVPAPPRPACCAGVISSMGLGTVCVCVCFPSAQTIDYTGP